MSQIHLYHNKPDEHYDRRHIAFMTAIGAAIGIGAGAAATGVAATVAGAAVVGAAAYGAAKLLSPKAPALPDYGISATKAAEPSLDKAEAAAADTIKRKRISIARNRTIFTNPLGLSDEEKSGTVLKTLTGV